MKDVVVVVGGDTERGLLLRDKLAIEQRRVKLCQSLREFFATISEETVDAIFLLFPDEFGVVSKLFDEGITSCFAGKVPVVFISASPNENNMARASYYKADEFLI
jgi:hypothetical protein